MGYKNITARTKPYLLCLLTSQSRIFKFECHVKVWS